MSERTPRVVLFCVHMIDQADRESERFVRKPGVQVDSLCGNGLRGQGKAPVHG